MSGNPETTNDLLEGLENARSVLMNLGNAGVHTVRKVTIIGREPLFIFANGDPDQPTGKAIETSTARR